MSDIEWNFEEFVGAPNGTPALVGVTDQPPDFAAGPAGRVLVLAIKGSRPTAASVWAPGWMARRHPSCGTRYAWRCGPSRTHIAARGSCWKGAAGTAWRARAGALAGVAAALTATGALLLHHQGPSPDPATVAAVAELARIEPPTPPPNGGSAEELRGGLLELGNQKVWLARHLVDGREVLVATSHRAFPMRADARPLGAERGAPGWPGEAT